MSVAVELLGNLDGAEPFQAQLDQLAVDSGIERQSFCAGQAVNSVTYSSDGRAPWPPPPPTADSTSS